MSTSPRIPRRRRPVSDFRPRLRLLRMRSLGSSRRFFQRRGLRKTPPKLSQDVGRREQISSGTKAQFPQLAQARGGRRRGPEIRTSAESILIDPGATQVRSHVPASLPLSIGTASRRAPPTNSRRGSHPTRCHRHHQGREHEHPSSLETLSIERAFRACYQPPPGLSADARRRPPQGTRRTPFSSHPREHDLIGQNPARASQRGPGDKRLGACRRFPDSLRLVSFRCGGRGLAPFRLASPARPSRFISCHCWTSRRHR